MTDYTQRELIDWMKVDSRLSKWGMFFVMNRARLDTLLLHEYIRRFSTTSYLPPISGSISAASGGTSWFSLNGFTLGCPRISFENLKLNDSKARLRMPVVAGKQISIQGTAQNYKVTELRHASPLQGPELSLELKLEDVPGIVGNDGNLYLDLSKSDNFSLSVSESALDQAKVGSFFKEKFQALPDAERRYILGEIAAPGLHIMRPQSFALRTQARQRDASDDEGAVVAFVCLEGEYQGDFPGENSNFRYLLPNDKDYSAAALFNPAWMMLEQLQYSINGLGLGKVRFTPTRDASNRLTGADVRAGTGSNLMYVPRQTKTGELDTEVDGQRMTVIYSFDVVESPIYVSDLLDIRMDGNRLELEWKLRGDLRIEMRSIDTKDGRLGRALELLQFDLSDFYKRTEDSFEYLLKASYELRDTNGGQLDNLSFAFSEVKAPAPPIGAIKPPVMHDGRVTGELEFWIRAVINVVRAVTVVVNEGIKAVFKIVDGLSLPSLELGLREHLQKPLTMAKPLGDLVQAVIALNLGEVISGNDVQLFKDVAFWGQVNPELSRYRVEPQEHTLAAGASKQFSVIPASTGVEWSVMPVLDGVQADQIGSIDRVTGVYTAPPANAFSGSMVQVKVQAVRRGAPYHIGSALLTVLKDTLELNPRVLVMQAGTQVQLHAGSLGAASNLRWSHDPALGGKLVANGLVATYTAPATFLPEPDGPPPFVVDKVLLGDASASPAQEAVLVVELAGATMKVEAEVDEANATVALQAIINGRPIPPASITWDVKHGPGSIDRHTGVYHHDPLSTSEFAVLTAALVDENFGLFKGYVIQVLPPKKLLV